MSKYNLHITKKGDTLQGIAKQYGIQVEELRRYHNIHCELTDLLGQEITNQKELFIPVSQKEENSEKAKEQNRKKVNFTSNNKLVYFPLNTHYRYGVMITLENGEEKNEIKYETSVKWIQKFENSHVLEIDRISNIYINEEEISNIADTLAYKTSKLIYPLQILVGDEANWEETAKYNKYPERWKKIKQEIRREFDGETVEEYLSKFEKILKTPELINGYLSGDLFLRTIFLGYCTSFENNFTKEIYTTFPVIDNPKEPRYKLHSVVDPYLDEYNLIRLEVEGMLDDERSKEDFINGNPFASDEIQSDKEKSSNSGSLSIKAFLNPNTCIPEIIQLECGLELEEVKKASVVIANLADTDTLRIRSRETIAEGKVPEKVGFWSSIKEFFKEMNDPDYFEEKHRKNIHQKMKK